MEKKCEAFFSFSFFNYLIGRNFLKFDELKHNVKPHQINMDVIKISIEDRYTKYDCTPNNTLCMLSNRIFFYILTKLIIFQLSL